MYWRARLSISILAYTKNLVRLPQNPNLAAEPLCSEKEVWGSHEFENGIESKKACKILHVWISSCASVLPYVGKLTTFEKSRSKFWLSMYMLASSKLCYNALQWLVPPLTLPSKSVILLWHMECPIASAQKLCFLLKKAHIVPKIEREPATSKSRCLQKCSLNIWTRKCLQCSSVYSLPWVPVLCCRGWTVICRHFC